MKTTLKYGLLLVIITLVATGCLTKEPLTREKLTTIQGLDFRAYSKQGFLFSPYEYKSGKFDILGIVNIAVYPRVHKSKYKNDVAQYISVGDTLRIVCGWDWDYCYDVQVLSDSTLLYESYKIATSMGADGICDLSVSSEMVNNNGLFYEVLKLRGVAIKRE